MYFCGNFVIKGDKEQTADSTNVIVATNNISGN